MEYPVSAILSLISFQASYSYVDCPKEMHFRGNKSYPNGCFDFCVEISAFSREFA